MSSAHLPKFMYTTQGIDLVKVKVALIRPARVSWNRKFDVAVKSITVVSESPWRVPVPKALRRRGKKAKVG